MIQNMLACLKTRGAAPVIFLLVLFGMAGCSDSRFSGLEPFPAQRYLEAAKNLQGNKFLLVAQIDSQLAYREGVGRLLAVRPEEDIVVPVMVPARLEVTVLPNQRFRFRVQVREGGLLMTEALEKY